jgi:hypothetical protein
VALGGGAPAEYWYRYAGKEMGKVGNDGTLYNSYVYSILMRAHHTAACLIP